MTETITALKYNHTSLLEEIKKMDKTEHAHAIIAIKDGFNKFPGRFLVYDDPRWGCRLFLNYPAKSTDRLENEKYLRTKLSEALKIPEEKISLQYRKTVTQEKYSGSHHEKRIYLHSYYTAEIRDFPDNEKENDFSIEGKSYHWMSIDEMLQDENIRKKNEDVIKEVNTL